VNWASTSTRPGRALLSGLLWTAPWWLGFLLFLAVPMVISLYISFCDYPLLQPPAFVGSANYQTLARDPVFHKVLANTILYAILAIPLGTIVAVLLAVLLNQSVRGQGLFRTCIFVPTVVPLVGAALVWLWMLNPEYGLINQAAQLVGPLFDGANWLIALVIGHRLEWLSELAAGPKWLSTPHWAMTSLVLISIWSVGSPVVIYLAGLQEIPEQLYEAAMLDGASAPRRFWHVTLPGLSPVILFNVIVAVIGTWQIFALPYVLMRGEQGPERSTYFYTMYLYDNAFRYLRMGYASAMAWIQLLIILVLTGVVFFVSRRAVYYRGT
jgi:multiple sugar transport system permease protein